MKTSIQKAERIEKVKRFLFAFHLTMVCMMFPVLYIVGIHGNKPSETTKVYEQNQVQSNPERVLVTASYPLSDQQG